MEENAIIKKVSFVEIFVNTLLTAFKLFAGIYGKSGAMVSDAIHSLADVMVTLIAFFGVRISRRSADERHPYGHERMECIASMILGLLLLVTGFGIGKVGLDNIFSGSYETLAIPGTIALVAAVVSIVGREGMYWYTRHYAKILNSPAFMADAWHHRTDAFSSVGSLIGIVGAILGFPVLDSVASVAICLFILKVAYDILRDSIDKMLDTSCGKEYDQKLMDYIAGQEGVLRVDMLRSRMFGSRVYADVEISMDGDKPLREAHRVAERVRACVEERFPEIKHVMVHVNPAD